MNECLICKEECRGKFCSSNCWNKGNKSKCKESQIRYRINNTEKVKIRRKKYKEENSERFKQSRSRRNLTHRKKHPEKHSARRKDYLKRDNQCKKCLGKENLEFHHTNYRLNKGFTLCKSCHRKLHKKNALSLEGGKK